MALKARTATAPADEQTQAPDQAPATTNQGGALTEPGNPAASLNELNPFLTGLDEGGGENKSRIVVDGSEFFYRSLDLRVSDLIIPGDKVTNGLKLFQWWPAKNQAGEQIEDGQMCMSYDHKTSVDGIPCASCPHFKDKTCKPKYELAFNELDPEQGEDVEQTLTMSQTGYYAFQDYVRALSKGQVASAKDMEFLKKPLDARKPNGPNNFFIPKKGEFVLTGPVGLDKVITRAIVQRRNEKNKTTGQPVTWGQPVFQAVGFVGDDVE